MLVEFIKTTKVESIRTYQNKIPFKTGVLKWDQITVLWHTKSVCLDITSIIFTSFPHCMLSLLDVFFWITQYHLLFHLFERLSGKTGRWIVNYILTPESVLNQRTHEIFQLNRRKLKFSFFNVKKYIPMESHFIYFKAHYTNHNFWHSNSTSGYLF